MKEYNDLKQLLKPRREIKAADRLRRRVNQAVDKRQRRFFNWIYSCAATAVAAMIAILSVSSGLSAEDMFRAAIKSMKEDADIELLVDVRTRKIENFAFIDMNEDFVRHIINVSRRDSMMRWRVDKGGRVAVGDNFGTSVWIKNMNIGWRYNEDASDELLGYLAIFLSPHEILQSELEYCLSGVGNEYHVTKHGEELHLTVHARPQGNFENPYKLNRSIPESENERTYIFDAETKRLKSASVKIFTGNGEIEVLRISGVNYGVLRPAITETPSCIKFIDIADNLAGLPGLSPVEAASVVLSAMRSWDSTVLDCVISPSISDAFYKEEFSGAVLLSVGQQFQSGNDVNTVYVPYRLQLRNGCIKNHNLSMSKNKNGNWIVTGGL